MALSTYSELQTSIANYLNRSDLTDNIPDFITLTEGKLNRDLLIRASVVRAETTTTSGTAFYNLPSDIIELKNITRDTTNASFALSYLSLESASREYGGVSSGFPRAYSSVGDTIKLLPTPDAAYTIGINYYQKLVALSDSNTSNIILENYPDLYLFGSCFEGALFLNDTEQSQRFGGIYAKVLQDVMLLEDRAEYSGTVLTMQGT
tara:strand:+ start:3891 stop:4508 length:618 start_codon:yes stop_codon:yes gene_type:complete